MIFATRTRPFRVQVRTIPHVGMALATVTTRRVHGTRGHGMTVPRDGSREGWHSPCKGDKPYDPCYNVEAGRSHGASVPCGNGARVGMTLATVTIPRKCGTSTTRGTVPLATENRQWTRRTRTRLPAPLQSTLAPSRARCFTPSPPRSRGRLSSCGMSGTPSCAAPLRCGSRGCRASLCPLDAWRRGVPSTAPPTSSPERSGTAVRCTSTIGASAAASCLSAWRLPAARSVRLASYSRRLNIRARLTRRRGSALPRSARRIETPAGSRWTRRFFARTVPKG